MAHASFDRRRKGLIVYFSQSGATAQIADAAARGLRAKDYEIELWNLRDGTPPGPMRDGLFGVGSPVYYYRIPFNVADYLENLPRLEGVPAFAFLVSGPHRFDAGNELRRRLARTGATEVGYFETLGAAHFLPHLKEGYLFASTHPTAADLLDAERFGVAVAEHVAGRAYVRPPEAPRAPFMYRLQRFVASRWLVQNVHRRFFKVDHERCTACGVCMASCPTGNVTRDERGHPRWGRACLGCFNCEKDCPEDAITSVISRPLARPLVRPFFTYNCRAWRDEAGAEYVGVVHRRGRTEIIATGGANRTTRPRACPPRG